MARQQERRTRCIPYSRIRNCPKHAIDNKVLQCDDDIWSRIENDFSLTNIFLNVTYIPDYADRLHSLLAFTLALGLNPVLASIPKREGVIRLCKLCELIQRCRFCITDISFANRHNMPFEAGLAYGLGRRNIFLFCGPRIRTEKNRKVKVIDERFSNLKSVDEVVYYRDKKGTDLIQNLLERFSASPELRQLSPLDIPTEQDQGYTKWLDDTSQDILDHKAFVDKIIKKERGSYAVAVSKLRRLVQWKTPRLTRRV